MFRDRNRSFECLGMVGMWAWLQRNNSNKKGQIFDSLEIINLVKVSKIEENVQELKIKIKFED